MGAIDELLAANEALAARSGEVPDARPSRRVAIVTCMDARIDLVAALGLGPGEAHVLRNAGGLVTDDVVRSLAISQRRLGTRETMLVQHTECGMEGLDEEGLREELAREAGTSPAFAIESFDDLDASVERSVRLLRDSPFLVGPVRGFVYDVATHRLREVGAAGGH